MSLNRIPAGSVFYRGVHGSIVDKTAFMDTVKVSGCRDGIIADKGFYSK